MRKAIMTGQIKPSVRGSGRLFTVTQDENGYQCILISQYDGKIIVESAVPLTREEVFKWLDNHKDY